jgi:hypothetical protein
LVEAGRPVKDRRRHRRIQPAAPLRGTVGAVPVVAIDASAGGVRLEHELPLPAPGSFCRLDLSSSLGPLKLDCQVIRTEQHDKLQTALAIISADRQSLERLRVLFTG